MHREQPQIEQRGGRLAVIGNGSAEQARAFATRVGYRGALYTDPALESYRALGLKRGLPALDPRGALAGARAVMEGFLPGLIQGDAGQLGGALVVLPGGLIAFAQRSRYIGDHPPVAALLAALPG